MALHSDLKESGLADMYGMSPVVDAEDPRAEWLGKKVRFKRSCDFKALGTLARDSIYVACEVQDNYRGEPRLRIYREDELEALKGDEPWRCFGRPASIDELELVD